MGFRRRRGGRRSQQTRPTGFPVNRSVTMRYIQSVQLSPTGTGSPVGQVFSANSCYDPDVTGTGHQPSSFDQWRQYYDNYCVIGSRIRVRGVQTTAVNPGILGVLLCNDPTAYSSYDSTTLREQGLGKHVIYQNSANGLPPRTLTVGYSAKKFWNLSSIKDNQYRLGAAFTASPPVQSYFIVWASNFMGNDGFTVAPLQLDVEIMYKVLLIGPRVLPAS